MKVHYVKVRAFARQDGVEALKEVLTTLLPEGTEVKEARLEPESEGEVFLEPMFEASARLQGNAGLDFLKKIISSLDEYDYTRMQEKKDLYMDDECNFYMRLSKTEAASGKTVLDSKDSIHVTARIAAYPARKENAMKVLDEIIKEAKDEE